MKELPRQIVIQKRWWTVAWIFWLGLYYLLGGVATLSTALIAVKQKSDIFPSIPLDKLSLVAVITSTLVAFAKIKEQAGAYLRSYRKLNGASIRFLHSDDYTIKQLLDTHDECEKQIEDSDAV